MSWAAEFRWAELYGDSDVRGINTAINLLPFCAHAGGNCHGEQTRDLRAPTFSARPVLTESWGPSECVQEPYTRLVGDGHQRTPDQRLHIVNAASLQAAVASMAAVALNALIWFSFNGYILIPLFLVPQLCYLLTFTVFCCLFGLVILFWVFLSTLLADLLFI